TSQRAPNRPRVDEELYHPAGNCRAAAHGCVDRRGSDCFAGKEAKRVSNPLANYLIVSAALFSIGLAGALIRRNAILVLIGIELMLNAANLNFIAFWRYGKNPQPLSGLMFVIFSIAVAAAEAAVGLALVIAIYRHYRTTEVDKFDQLRG